MRTTYRSTFFCFVVIVATISKVESTWLLQRGCNGTTLQRFGNYANGDCDSIGYGTCSGSTYTRYYCQATSNCESCQDTPPIPMGKCDDSNLYRTCTSGAPDFSPFGPSYATVSIYSDKECSSEPIGISATIINECIVTQGNPGSIYASCAKDGSVTLTLYKDFNCQQIQTILQANTDVCTNDQQKFPLPFIATCQGF